VRSGPIYRFDAAASCPLSTKVSLDLKRDDDQQHGGAEIQSLSDLPDLTDIPRRC
jgi:hypothetical protein